jgi:opacity protein-like surface antigen
MNALRYTSWLLIWLLLAAPASAQSRTPVQLSAPIPAGVRLVVTTVEGDRVSGRVRAVGADAVTLDTPSGPRTIPADRIARIIERDPVRNGLLIGAAVGAAAGLSFGMVVNMICESESGGCPGVVMVLTGIGAVSGGGLGAGIDGLRQRTLFDRIPTVPGEFVPEVAANVGFSRFTTWNMALAGLPSAGASWSLRHPTSGWGVELQANRMLGSSTRVYSCPDPAIRGCGDAQEGLEDLTAATALVQYFLPSSRRLQPYVGGGLALYQASVWRADLRPPFFGQNEPIVVDALRRQRGVGLVAGGGARIQLSPHLSVRPDLTYYHADDWQQLRGSVGVGFSW